MSLLYAGAQAAAGSCDRAAHRQPMISRLVSNATGESVSPLRVALFQDGALAAWALVKAYDAPRGLFTPFRAHMTPQKGVPCITPGGAISFR